jgi:hypothetical protein
MQKADPLRRFRLVCLKLQACLDLKVCRKAWLPFPARRSRARVARARPELQNLIRP